MLNVIPLHDLITGAYALGTLLIFIGVWMWVGDVLDNIPSTFKDDTHDYWGL